MNNKTSASVKMEQPEVYVDYPGEEIMGSESLSPSNNIKLETFCECDNVQSFTEAIISEVQVFDKVDSKTSVKIEQPEVYVDYADEDMKIHACSQSCPSLQEQSQTEMKMVFIDRKHMKHELSDHLYQKKNELMSIASCCTIPEITGNNTELRLSEDTTAINHQEVSSIGTENGYMALQKLENCSYLSKAVTSMVENDTKIHLTDENSELHNVDMPTKQTQISRKPINSIDDAPDYTHGSPKKIQAEDTACVLDNFDVTINVNTLLHRHKKTDPGEKVYIYNIRDFVCDICSASFTQFHNLECHMRTHAGEKPYKCDICSASFTTNYVMNCHRRIHTGEKLYKCDICSVSFTMICNLKRHMRTHTGEKPYKCDVCTASFTLAGSLRCHRRIHTGEKPYKCDVCAASFAQVGRLKYHKRTQCRKEALQV